MLRITQNISSLFYLLPIGKVAIKKEDLCNYNGKETWFSLQPIDSNSEVQVNIKSLSHKENEWKTNYTSWYT